jgi:uncharacterized lipoprotein YddW (UPF0748 family)
MPAMLFSNRMNISLPSQLCRRCLVLASLVLHFGCEQQVFTGKREARGVWMSRFELATDSLRGNPAATMEHIRHVFTRARSARLNMVFFQIRGNADALYDSRYEPWSAMLTGEWGRHPGWDPLQFAVDEAHRLGLELHAWFNTFPLWRGPGTPPECSPRPIVLEYPEWIVCDSAGIPMPVGPSGYVWGSPGNPALRKHIVNVVRDIVGKYDIDGIHFDYLRYPEQAPNRGYSKDSVSMARFLSDEENPSRLSWEHWQREQVNAFVYDAYNAVSALKPWVKVSAAVVGKYSGSGWTSYHAVYQDPRRWMEVGKIDFVVPMVYWERSHPTHPFIPLITEWHDRRSYDRLVIPGISTELQKKFGWSELSAQIRAVRENGLPGVVFFASGGLERAWETLGVKEFPYWALPPSMPWKDSIPPPPPTNLEATTIGGGVRLSWRADTSEVLSFIVYRSAEGRLQKNDVMQIMTITGRGERSYLDRSPLSGDATYAVFAVDRMGNESVSGAQTTVRPSRWATNKANGRELQSP